MYPVSGVSNLELRRIIEAALLPRRCKCTSDKKHMTVQVFSEDKKEIELTVAGIALDSLTNSRAIAQLVQDLKSDLLHLRNGRERSSPS